MSVAALGQDERAILVALNNHQYDFHLAAKELGISVVEVADSFDLFKHLVRDGRLRTNWLTGTEIAMQLNCGRECAIALLAEYDHLLVEKTSPNGQLLRYYPPVVVSLLRPYFDLNEDGVNWYTVTQIRSITKKDFDWTRRNVAQFGETAKLKIASDGKLRLHYPEPVVRALTDTAEPPVQAGDYLHVAEISRLTGLDPGKIRSVIAELGINSEKRHVTHFGITDCYPPEILDLIIAKINSVKLQGYWFTVNEIAKELDQTNFRIKSLIKASGFRGQKRLSTKTGRVHTHYSPRTLELLRDVVVDTKPHGGWYTSENIQKFTGRSHGWVRKRLEDDRFPREVRIATNNVPRIHYPPWVAFFLKLMK